MGTNISQQLRIVNIQNNIITSVELSSTYNNTIMWGNFYACVLCTYFILWSLLCACETTDSLEIRYVATSIFPRQAIAWVSKKHLHLISRVTPAVTPGHALKNITVPIHMKVWWFLEHHSSKMWQIIQCLTHYKRVYGRNSDLQWDHSLFKIPSLMVIPIFGWSWNSVHHKAATSIGRRSLKSLI